MSEDEKDEKNEKANRKNWGLTVEETLYWKIKQAAVAERCTVSSLVTRALTEWLENKGLDGEQNDR